MSEQDTLRLAEIEEQIRAEAAEELDRLRATIAPMDDQAVRDYMRELTLQTHVDQKANAKRRAITQQRVDDIHTALFMGDPNTKTPSLVEWAKTQRISMRVLASIVAGAITVLGILPFVWPFFSR